MNTALFDLVPAVYRLRDAQVAQTMALLTPAEQAALAALQAITIGLTPQQQAQLDQLVAKSTRGPLQSILMVLDEQLAALAEDLDQFYDDLFIETCAPWVIPYIGDLIGFQAVQGISAAVDSPRSEVASTIAMRRRKGTPLVLEELARDITGWGAHSVEFFRLLATTQYMKHVRDENFYTANLRGWQSRVRVNTGFDRVAHKVDVHNIANGMGPYNIQNIGIFLWSLGAYSLTLSPASPSLTNTSTSPLCFRFNPLGIDAPLFHRAQTQGRQIAAPAQPENIPDQLRRVELCEDLQRSVGSSYYGAGSSLALYLDDRLLNPYELQVANLSGAEGSWANLPTATSPFKALIDPHLGRIALPPVAPGSPEPHLDVSFHYGLNAGLGGGEYARATSFTVTNPANIFPYPDTAVIARYNTLQQAIDFVIAQLAADGSVCLEFTASKTFTEASPSSLQLDLPAGTTFELRGAEGARPTLFLNAELSITGEARSRVLINGIQIAASPAMPAASPALVHLPPLRPNASVSLLQTLSVLHCTLVPGWSLDTSAAPTHPSAVSIVAETAGADLNVSRSILGALRTSSELTVQLIDSIVDATARTLPACAALDGAGAGAALTVIGCTVIGKVHAQILTLVSNSIFWSQLAPGDTWRSTLIAERRQQGCVRYSFLPVKAIVPRRYRCVDQALASVQPLFFTLRYGHPAYLKLLACTDSKIRRGAEDAGEMGAFHFVQAPQRESDLKIRLQEFLPVGLQAGIVYQS